MSSCTQSRITGKERDSETGLDYFGARYYGSNMGRWMSPDPINLSEERIASPAFGLNKYAYAANNPLKYVDDDGKDVTVMFLPPHGFFPGHIMMFAHNPNNGDSALMSFGPIDTSGANRAIQAVNGPVDGTTNFEVPQSADELRSSYATLTIQTTPEEAQQVIEFLRNVDGSWWRLGGPNCATVCRDALKATGLLPKDSNSIAPATFWQDVYVRYSNPAYRSYNATFRLNIPNQAGRDYGRPRYRMNPFDFIALQLKNVTATVTTEQGPVTPCGGKTGRPCPK